MEVIKALELLETVSLKTESETDRASKLKAIKTVDEQLTLPILRNSNEFHKLLSFAIHALLRLLQDSDMNVWSLAEQALVKIIKLLNRTYHEWIVYEVWKGIKGIKVEGRSRRFAIELFSLQAHRIQPAKADQFRASLLKALVGICSEHGDQLLQEALAKHIEPIIQYQLSTAPISDMAVLLDELTSNVSSPHSKVRRSATQCLVMLCRHHRQHGDLVRATMERMYHLTLMSANKAKAQQKKDVDQGPSFPASPPKQMPPPQLASIPTGQTQLFTAESIVEASGVASTYVLQGVLHCYRQLLRVSQEFVPRDRFAVTDPMLPYLVSITDIGIECLKNDDNNVIVATLELIQEVLKCYWGVLGELSPNDARVGKLLKRFDAMLFGGRKVKVSVQVLVVACSALLAHRYPKQLQPHMKEKLPTYMELLKNSDQFLRGQAYMFVGSLIAGYLGQRSSLRDEWNLDVFNLLWTLLFSVMKDDSAIAAKMACQALSTASPLVQASEYAFFIPAMIQHLLCLPKTSYLLLKLKVLSLLARLDFRSVLYFEESVRDFRNKNPGVTLPEQLTTGQNLLQSDVVDFIISFLEDGDPRVRHKAGKVLVRMIPQIHYNHYFDTVQKKKTAICISILDKQTSQHMTKVFNNQFKEPTDSLLWRLIGKMNQSVDSVFIKGFYHFVRQLLEEGYQMPGQLISVILDQLACSNLATDVEAQLDITVMLSFIVKHLSGDMTQFIMKIFIHMLRLLTILTSILQGKSVPAYKELKPGMPEGPAGSVQGQPQYLQLWERLQDTFRVSLTSLHPNLFDDLCVATVRGMDRIVVAMGRSIAPYADELLLLLPDHFEKDSDGVVQCLGSLVGAILADAEAPKTVAASADSPVATEPRLRSIFDTAIPSFDFLLNPSLTLDNKQGPATPSGELPIKRRLPKTFEPMLAMVMEKYEKIQSAQLRRTTLRLLSSVASLEVDYPTLDRDFHFLRQIHQTLIRAQHNQTLHLAKTAGVVSFSDLAASQLAFLYELHFRAGVNLSGTFSLSNVDLALLVPVAFECSWGAPENYYAFEAMAEVLFLNSLENRLKRKRQEAEKAKFKKAPANRQEEAEEDRVESAAVHDMRREFISQILSHVPDPRAVALLIRVTRLLKAFNDKSHFNEFSKLIASRILVLLSDSPLLAKNSVEELYTFFDLVDSLPREAFSLDAVTRVLMEHFGGVARSAPTPTSSTQAHGIQSAKPPAANGTATSDEKRPEFWELNLFRAQKRYWLPVAISLFRVLVKFNESETLGSVSRVLGTNLDFGDNAPTQAPEVALATVLFKLISDASCHFDTGIPVEDLDKWSRLTCIMLHFIVYFSDKHTRNSTLLRKAVQQFLNPADELLRDNVMFIIQCLLLSSDSSACFMLCKLFDRLQADYYIDSLVAQDAARKWSWHSEILRAVAAVTLARINSSLSEDLMPSDEDIAARSRLAQHLSKPTYLELFSYQIGDEDVKKLIQRSPHEQHQLVFSYVEGQLKADEKSEMLSPERTHQLLLLLTCLPPSEEHLRVLFTYFAANGHISVQIAAEHYIWNLLNEFDIFRGDGADDSLLKSAIEKHKKLLRPSFARRLRKMHWLQLVSLSQTDLPTFGTDSIDDSSPITKPGLSSPSSEAPTSPLVPKLESVKTESGVEIIRGSSLEPQSFMKYFQNRDNTNYLKIIQTLTAVMSVSKDLFVQLLQSPVMQPYFLSFCLQNPAVANVKDEILVYLNSEMEKWLTKNFVPVEALILTESIPIKTAQELLASINSPSQSEPGMDTDSRFGTNESFTMEDVLSPPISPVRGHGRQPSDDFPLSPGGLSASTHLLSPPMSPGITDLKPISAMLDESGVLSGSPSIAIAGQAQQAVQIPSDVVGSPGNVRLIDYSESHFSKKTDSSRDLHDNSADDLHDSQLESHENEYANQSVKIKGKFHRAESVPDGVLVENWRSTLEFASLLALSLHRFSKEWPKQVGSSLPNLAGGPLLAFATCVLERLLFLHERKISILASFDFVVVLALVKQIVSAFSVTSDCYKKVDNAKRLIYYLYELYFILFKPDKKEVLDYTSFEQVDFVLQFFWRFSREWPWNRQDSELTGRTRSQSRFISVLHSIGQSSQSVEISVYPIQRDPINFDYNDEPVRTLEQFILLVNTMHPAHSSTFNKVWDQLYSGISPDSDIMDVATSTSIKALSVRGLTSLLLRAGFKAADLSHNAIELDENGVPTIDPLHFDLARLRKFASLSWKEISIQGKLNELMEVFKPVIEQYSRVITSELGFQLECLRSVVLLSDFFTEKDYQWMLETFLGILEQQQEPWDEDVLAKQHLLLGICKAIAVLQPTLEKLPHEKLLTYTQRITKALRYHIHSMRLKEIEIHDEKRGSAPVSAPMFMLAFYYLMDAKKIVEIRVDDELIRWINGSSGDPRMTPFSRNAARVVMAKLSAAKKDQHDQGAPDSDVELKFIEEIKTLFIKIRKSPLVHVERLAKGTIPMKLVASFTPDQILSMLLGELTRPEQGVQNIALILYHTLAKLREKKSHPDYAKIESTVARWILMLLPNFVQLAKVNKLDQAQWASAALFLAASPNPLQRAVFFDLIAEPDLHVDERIFLLAGLDFFCNQNFDIDSKKEIITAISQMSGEFFKKLTQSLTQLYDIDVSKQEAARAAQAIAQEPLKPIVIMAVNEAEQIKDDAGSLSTSVGTLPPSPTKAAQSKGGPLNVIKAFLGSDKKTDGDPKEKKD